MQFEYIHAEHLDPFDPRFNHRKSSWFCRRGPSLIQSTAGAVELNENAWPHIQLFIFSPVSTPRSLERVENWDNEMNYRREDSGDEIDSELSEDSGNAMEEDVIIGLARIGFQDC